MGKKNMREKTFVIQGYNTGDGIGMHIMHAANCPRAYKEWWEFVNSEWYTKEDGDPRHREDHWLYHVVGEFPQYAYHNWKHACAKDSVLEDSALGEKEWDMAIVSGVLCSDESLRLLNVGQETLIYCTCCEFADSSWNRATVDWFAKEYPDYPIPAPSKIER